MNGSIGALENIAEHLRAGASEAIEKAMARVRSKRSRNEITRETFDKAMKELLELADEIKGMNLGTE